MDKFFEAPISAIEMRNTYLDCLAAPQGLYVEHLVSTGRAWRLGDLAYAVVCDGTLVEFFVDPKETRQLVEIFDMAMRQTGASTVLCKSFDTQLMYVALSRPAHITTVGFLYRHIADPHFEPRDDVSFIAGSLSDADTIFGFNDDFFEDIQEIQDYAESGGLFLLKKAGEIIGCGIGKSVIEARPDIDIGMLVAPMHRRHGFGSHIIAFLKDHYLQQGLRPICGCSVDNIGSQRALNNAGLVSEHRLLQISY